MRLARLASSAVTGALLGALIPIFALLLLAPANYGAFSTIYLFFAYGVSLQYSIVSETWARARRQYQKATAWPDYSTALFALAGTVALAALVASLLVAELRAVAGHLGVAVLFGVYRSGARYYWLARGMIRRIVVSDLLGVMAFVGVFFIMRTSESIVLLATAWSLPMVASSVGLGLPSLRRRRGLLRWWRTHHREIKPLLSDSLLMDAGAIGAPFLLVGFMGAEKFGLYRGIANAAMPVRLLLDPLRPALGRKPRAFYFRKSVIWLLGCTTLVIGAACYLALEFIVPSLSIRSGTLSEMSVFALPAAVFASANFVGTVYYIACRTNSGRKAILTGRICQTTVVVAMPIFGFVTQGLEGAIWGFAISASVSALIWLFLAVPPAKDYEPSPEKRIATSSVHPSNVVAD